VPSEDLQGRSRWVQYWRAKFQMFRYPDIKQPPWYVVEADAERKAHLNCIDHLLSLVPYEDLTPALIEPPPRQPDLGSIHPPLTDRTFVPEVH
jgi:hypothetical protein